MLTNYAAETCESLIDRLRRQTPSIPVTVALVAVNLLAFVAMLASGAGLWHSPNNLQLEWGANFAPATEDGEWWRLGTALFLHFGLLHLATNMLALAEAGHLVERMFGHARFATIYFASGVTGNLLSLITHGDGAVSGGASGAIFGIYGAMLVHLALHRQQLQRHEFGWLFWGAMAFSTFTVVFGMLVPGIDNAAHLGGLLAGVLGGFALAAAAPESTARRQPQRALAAGAWLAIIIGLAAAIPAPHYRWREEQQAQGRINEFLGEDRRLSASWNAIMEQGKNGGESFDQLAARLESDVASNYARSFDRLSALHLDSAAPSSPALDFVRNYAELRRDAAQAMVDGLRQDDQQKVRAAIELATKVPKQRSDASLQGP
jgi:rhomboid protease GluP